MDNTHTHRLHELLRSDLTPPRVYAAIDPAALTHNYRLLADRAKTAAGQEPIPIAVVKADAYGHGIRICAKALAQAGCRAFAVACIEEAVALRQVLEENGTDGTVLILGYTAPACAALLAAHRLTAALVSADHARRMSDAACAAGVRVRAHLALDTGMNRIGVRTAEEAQALTRLIDSLPGVALTGCFTHMATADEPDPTGTLRQIERFEALCKAVKAVHPGEIICHGANTASIFRYPQLHADMVRGGLALYGYPPVPEATGLQPAMRWVTRGIYVKTIAPGDRVSYGGTFVATRPTVVMTLPVGYADGYRRGISGKGCVLVRGRRAPILGRVCMDQMMVDVTDIPGAQEGDEAVLLGRQGEEQIDAEEMAAWLDTISYEVLCSPSKRVPRVYINA